MEQHRTPIVSLSVVVPVYRGETYLPELMHELDALRTRLREAESPVRLEEVVFVDDGAVDGSAQVIDGLAQRYPYATALHLARNFGQHPATIAGILHTSGDWVATLDEDLQHPPSRLPELLATVAETGADVVYGKPESAVHQSAARDFTSRNFKALIERLTGNRHIVKANSFRLIRGQIARAASSVCGQDTYFDVALSWFTQRIVTRRMPLKDRRFIETRVSGYGFRSLLSHARRLAFSSQIKLLRLAAIFGFAVLVLTVIATLALLVVTLLVPEVIAAPGWSSIMLAICFFSGATLFLLGILLEYVSILVLRAHGKPLYFTVDRSLDRHLAGLRVRAD